MSLKRTKLHHVMILLLLILAVDVKAEGQPQCGVYACAIHSLTSNNVSQVRFENRHASGLICYVAVNGKRTVFELSSYRGPFRAGPGVTASMFSWRCDPKTPRPAWYSGPISRTPQEN